MTAVLYITDNNLRLQLNASSDDVIQSRGYAWFREDDVVFDISSEQKPIDYCRLAPEQINNRYWQQCDQSSIASNAVGMRNAADLVWKHLSQLKDKYGLNEIIFVVPSHYQSSSLQLLLGIAQSMGIKVLALINGAVLSLANSLGSDGEYLHLDVQLHQTVQSEIHVADGVAKLESVEIIQNVSIQAMQDALLKAIQKHFIQNDRFDPLHYAETEQQLFNQLDEIGTRVNESAKSLVSVEYQQKLHSTNLDAKLWNSALMTFTEQLLLPTRQFDHSYVQLNGAFGEKALPTLNLDNVSILNDDVIVGALNLPAFLAEDGGLHYITQYPLKNVVQSDASALKVDDTSSPTEQSQESLLSAPRTRPTGATHLLQSGIAVPIESAELRLESQQLILDVSSSGNAQAFLESGKLFVMNDESIKIFRPNDRIGSHLADGVITVIQVV